MTKKKIRSKEIRDLIASKMVYDVLSFDDKKYNDASVILLNDGKTYILLEEQDYYSYHDCSSSARHIDVHVNKDEWNRYKSQYYPAADLT